MPTKQVIVAMIKSKLTINVAQHNHFWSTIKKSKYPKDNTVKLDYKEQLGTGHFCSL
jgi:hypothetical protein